MSQFVLYLFVGFATLSHSFVLDLPPTTARRRILLERRIPDATTNFPLTVKTSSKCSSQLCALDPRSPASQDLVVTELELSAEQHGQLAQLCELIVEWNQNINLVSRKDCTVETVWERHVLPCLAACTLKEETTALVNAKSVVDVGTGGGFPGLPLAICFPDTQFTLLDSVGKKLTAVEDMAQQLGLGNVQIHHGRAEDLVDQQFDVATGRSVSAMDQFCCWMQHLLKPGTGVLMYWIGGEIPEHILNRSTMDVALASRIPVFLGESDKRILVFPQKAVTQIAKESGIVVTKRANAKNNGSKHSSKTKNNNANKKKKTAKGAWKRNGRKDDEGEAASKQRGYDNFQRFSSQ